jgi:nicotinamidase/pyrazinamidase
LRKDEIPVKITDRDVLLVIDVQNDFCPGGALAVPRGDEVVPVINRIIPMFRHIVLTQDWHPRGHLSFASSHAGAELFAAVTVTYGEQTLWPDHCVQGSGGAEFHPELDVERAELILRKGFRREIDSYSAFQENDRKTKTGLAGYLRERGFERVFLAGLAYDFCVCYSAVDARADGFEAVVIEDACRGIGLHGSVEATREEFSSCGVEEIAASELG